MRGILAFLGVCVLFAHIYAKDVPHKQGANMTKQVYIVHGFGASADKHWFNWLKNALQKDKNVSVKILNMPNSENPSLEQWLETLRNEANVVGENTYFVGHSLGCISILRYLASLDSKNAKVGGVILVSGFYESLRILPQLDSFTKPKLDMKKLTHIVQNRLVISARDDEIVPTNLSENLAKILNATFIQTPNGKHFMDKDGVTQMPLVLFILQHLFTKDKLI